MRAISIIIPCYDEMPSLLTNSVKKLRKKLAGLKLDIIIVENGSTRLRGIAGTRYYNIKRRGLGDALKLGINKAKNENVFFLPADMSYDLRFVKSALSEVADIVIGSKMARGSVVERPLTRKAVSWAYSWKTRLMNGTRVRDITGVKLYKKSKVVPLLGACGSPGIQFEVELEQQAERHHLRVREIPVTVYDYRNKGVVQIGIAEIIYDYYRAIERHAFGKLREEEFRRYLFVGLVGIVLFEGAFFILNNYLSYWLSYLVSFESVTDINFIMHDSITFRGAKHYTKWKRFAIFQSQAVIYRIIQYTVFFSLSLVMNLYVALLIAIFVAFGYSYMVNKRITWKGPDGNRLGSRETGT